MHLHLSRCKASDFPREVGKADGVPRGKILFTRRVSAFRFRHLSKSLLLEVMYSMLPAPSALCAAQQIRHGEVLVRLDWEESGRGVIRVCPVRTEPKENERLVPFERQKRAESIRRPYGPVSALWRHTVLAGPSDHHTIKGCVFSIEPRISPPCTIAVRLLSDPIKQLAF